MCVSVILTSNVLLWCESEGIPSVTFSPFSKGATQAVGEVNSKERLAGATFSSTDGDLGS